MEINYQTKDKSIDIKLVYIVKRQLKMYYIGKTWPKHTQCLFYYNGLLRGFGTVVLHYTDKDNQRLAYKLATKKAIVDYTQRWLRKELWKTVITELDKISYD